MSKDSKGIIAEAKVLARLLEMGKSVLTPFGGKEPYDILVDNQDGTYTKVQVKSSWRKQGCLLFRAHKASGNRVRVKSSYVGYADIFAVYDDVDDKVYFVPVFETKSDVWLRVDKPKIHRSNIRYASDYLEFTSVDVV